MYYMCIQSRISSALIAYANYIIKQRNVSLTKA